MESREQNIPLFKVFMAPTVGEEVNKVLYSGYIGQGAKVDEFENNIKEYFNHDYVQTLNSGTSGLHLALHLLKKPYGDSWFGMEPGDEILATPLTCTASNWPILANGFKIKWVDIDPGTLNMDLDDLARKITSKTKAIIPVHWGGYPNDLDKIANIQETAKNILGFKPAVIEDGAHAFGSKYKGKYLGTHGNMMMYSLQAIKHITSIDGGLLLCPNNELHKRGKLIRWYGIDRNSDRKDFRCEANIDEWGFKFHMNDVCATVGIENHKHIESIVSRHRENAAFYDKELANVDRIKLLDRHTERESAFWLYSMLVEDRSNFYKWMNKCGITVSQVHERNDIHSCVKEFKTQLPQLDRTIGKVVSIPVGWWITDEQRSYIVDCIKKGW